MQCKCTKIYILDRYFITVNSYTFSFGFPPTGIRCKPFSIDLPADLSTPTMAIEADVPQNTSAFPQNLPPREQSWKQRNCPNMRVCWHVSLSSYDPRNCPDKRTLWRRIAMILILFARTAMSVLTVISAVRRFNVLAIIIYAILAVLGFWFVTWCLAIIGDAVGERKVFGKLIVSLNWQPLLCWPIPDSKHTSRRAEHTLMASCTALLPFISLSLFSGCSFTGSGRVSLGWRWVCSFSLWLGLSAGHLNIRVRTFSRAALSRLKNRKVCRLRVLQVLDISAGERCPVVMPRGCVALCYDLRCCRLLI